MTAWNLKRFACGAAIAAMLLATGAEAAHGSSADCENPAQLRFSIIPMDDTQKQLTAYRPLFERLETVLGKRVVAIAPSSYGAVVEGLLAGSIDLAVLGPASYVSAKRSDPDITVFATYAKKAGAFREEGAFYRSMLIVKKGARLQTVESLRGATLAFVDPVSTSGTVLPLHVFPKVIGMPVNKYFGRITYAGDHPKAALAVLNGQVDAAFVSGTYLSELVLGGRAKPEDILVLWRSEPIPMDPIVYRGHLCEALKDKIRKVFLEAGGEKDKVLLDNLRATRFVPMNDADYRIIWELPGR